MTHFKPEVVEKVARAIDPEAFAVRQSPFDGTLVMALETSRDAARQKAQAALSIPELAALYEALERLVDLERSIKIDVGLLHKNRLRQSTSSDLQIAIDADFRSELEAAFDQARKALTLCRKGTE